MINLILMVIIFIMGSGICYYLIRLGRNKEIQKQNEDLINESKELNQESNKRMSDSINRIRERLSSYARKE